MIRWLEARVPPPLVTLATGLVMWGVARVSPLFSLHAPLRLVLVAALTLCAVGVAATGLLAFRRAGTTIDPTNPSSASTLVTGGIYGFTRNPMYLGFAGLLLGWAFYLQAWWSLPWPLIFAVYITVLQIAPEERALKEKFGVQFLNYSTRVRRWL